MVCVLDVGFWQRSFTVKVRVSFLKLDPRILPDMGIKVTFLGAEQKKQPGTDATAILIPQSAVHDENGKNVVFLVKDDKTERRAVTLGAKRGSDTEVIAGITAGDTLVVKGPGNLRDGQSGGRPGEADPVWIWMATRFSVIAKGLHHEMAGSQVCDVTSARLGHLILCVSRFETRTRGERRSSARYRDGMPDIVDAGEGLLELFAGRPERQ